MKLRTKLMLGTVIGTLIAASPILAELAGAAVKNI